MNTRTAAILLFSLTAMTHAEDVVFKEEIRVSATPDAVWEALTVPELVKTYHFAELQKIELKKDGEILYGKGGNVMISGTVTEVEPKAKLAHTFRFGAAKHPGTETDASTLVTYTIRKDGDATVLTLTHSGFAEKNQTYANVTGGWPFILKKMKVLLDSAPAK